MLWQPTLTYSIPKTCQLEFSPELETHPHVSIRSLATIQIRNHENPPKYASWFEVLEARFHSVLIAIVIGISQP